MDTLGSYMAHADRTEDSTDVVAYSPLEVTLAQLLTGRGLKYRQQVRAGGYVLDFLVEGVLCVEIDGRSHHGRAAEDRVRDKAMLDMGIWTLRIPARVFYVDPGSVCNMVANKLSELRLCGAPQCPEEQESLERLAGTTPTISTDRNTSI